MTSHPSPKPSRLRPRQTAQERPGPIIRVVLFEHQFADVMADRLTFEQDNIVLWLQGTEVARHHVPSVDALKITPKAVTGPRRPPRRASRRRPSVPLMLPKPSGAA